MTRPFHPFFWAVLVLPFGLAVGYAQVAMPFVLRARGVDVLSIAGVASTAGWPHFLKFFWAPALDAGWPRRNWFVLMIGLTALLLGLCALIPPDPGTHFGPVSLLAVYATLLTLAQATVATSSSAVLALISMTVPPIEKPRASGWQTAGNLVGTSAGGAGAVWLTVHVPPVATAVVLGGTCIACALPILFVVEPPLVRHRTASLVRVLLKDVWAIVRSRIGWTGLLICLSPVGTGAMTYLFSALATDYSDDPATRERMVLLADGLGGALAGALGALLGGYAVGRMNLRVAYALFGGLTAVAAIGMILGPANATTFSIGCLAYYFANGLCYAAFYAFVFEMIDESGGGGAVTSKLAVFVGASNFPAIYVTWLDGLGYHVAQKHSSYAWAGRAGMLGADALQSFVGIGAMFVMLAWMRRSSTPRLR